MGGISLCGLLGRAALPEQTTDPLDLARVGTTWELWESVRDLEPGRLLADPDMPSRAYAGIAVERSRANRHDASRFREILEERRPAARTEMTQIVG